MSNGLANEYLPSAEEIAGAVGRPRRRNSTTPEGERLAPYSPEAEQGALGCILLSPMDSMGACIERFRNKGDVFYDLRNQTIWNVLLEMYDKQEAIDVILLQQKLKDKGVLEQVGGIPYLATLPDTVPSAANISYYLDIVHEKFLFREVIDRCTEAVRCVYDFEGPAERLLETLEAQISSLSEQHLPASEEHIREVAKRVVNSLEERHYSRGKTQLRGLPTGKAGNYLDKMIGGIRESYYMVLAGRPGSGKTSLAMNIVEYLAMDYDHWIDVDESVARAREKDGEAIRVSDDGKTFSVNQRGIPVAVFSIEMDADCLVERLMFGRAGVDSAQFGQGYAHEGDVPKLVKAGHELRASNIYIDASPEQSIGQIAAKARRMVKQYGIKLFVLDYVQLVEQEGGNGFDRVREITKISRKIMALKKQLKVPWLVLAQMNRNIETAEVQRKPVLSDLKDCGALEQDCDLAIFTYKTTRKELDAIPSGSGTESDREILDRVTGDWDWSRRPYRVDLVVPKYRFGPTGEAKMVFCKNLCRFEDWHLWKLQHGAEGLKKGETKRGMGLPTEDQQEMGASHE